MSRTTAWERRGSDDGEQIKQGGDPTATVAPSRWALDTAAAACWDPRTGTSRTVIALLVATATETLARSPGSTSAAMAASSHAHARVGATDTDPGREEGRFCLGDARRQQGCGHRQANAHRADHDTSADDVTSWRTTAWHPSILTSGHHDSTGPQPDESSVTAAGTT